MDSINKLFREGFEKKVILVPRKLYQIDLEMIFIDLKTCHLINYTTITDRVKSKP
jgi:hypothetical protein